MSNGVAGQNRFRFIAGCVALAAVWFALMTTDASAADVVESQEFALKAPRSRDPVLGGARDTVVVTVWIPDGVKVVRGAMCNPFSKAGEVSGHWKAACRHWQFAYVQVDFDAVKKDEFELLFRGLEELAAKTGHPELAHVPLCYTGMSRGGGMSMQLAEMHPERTIASVPVCLEVGPTSAATRKVPVLTIFGEKDGSQMKLLLEKLPLQRAESAEWAIAVQWGRKHEFALANNLSFVFLDDVIARRLPSDFEVGKPVPLHEIPEREGWLGETASWTKDGVRPVVATHADFKADRANACWFPCERVALTWQAFVSASKDVKFKQPAGLGDGQPFMSHRAADSISIALDVSSSIQATKVEIWDGAKRIGERDAAPWEFDVRLPAGIHGLYAVAHVSDKPAQCSRLHTVVVEP